uniref:Cysteine protease n=1 Tax=Macrostomum lignano TaxID=282301 RepID=A0A1I8F2V7_9PLAT
MLRCGQMMLAEAIVRPGVASGESFANDATYRDILRLFEDNKAAPFSIHQIASMGVSDGKPVGQWFGPNTVAQSDTQAVCRLYSAAQLTPKLCCYLCPFAWACPTSTKQYVPALKRCLEMPQSLGIIGGKPNHAHYFIGYQGNELYYLDPPHNSGLRRYWSCGVWRGCCCSSVWKSAAPRTPVITVRAFAGCRSPRLDPSLAVGFVCANEAQLDDLCASLVRRMVQQFDLPLFEVHQTRPSHWAGQEDEEDDNYVLCVKSEVRAQQQLVNYLCQ